MYQRPSMLWSSGAQSWAVQSVSGGGRLDLVSQCIQLRVATELESQKSIGHAGVCAVGSLGTLPNYSFFGVILKACQAVCGP